MSTELLVNYLYPYPLDTDVCIAMLIPFWWAVCNFGFFSTEALLTFWLSWCLYIPAQVYAGKLCPMLFLACHGLQIPPL